MKYTYNKVSFAEQLTTEPVQGAIYTAGKGDACMLCRVEQAGYNFIDLFNGNRMSDTLYGWDEVNCFIKEADLTQLSKKTVVTLQQQRS